MNHKVTRLLPWLALYPMLWIFSISLVAAPSFEGPNLSKAIIAKNLSIEVSNPNNPAAAMDFLAEIANVTSQKGADFCVQVKVTNFTNLIGMQFAVNYNPSKLTFKEVKNFNLAGLNASSFGIVNGKITVSWTEASLTATTLPAGTALFDICFTAVNADATDNLTFTDGEIIQKTGPTTEATVPFTSTPGKVTIGAGGTTGPGNLTPVTVAVQDIQTTNGVEFCAKVTVTNFTSLIGLDFTLRYDANTMDFVRVTNLNLSGLAASSFTLPGVGSNPTGAVRMLWSSSSASGITVTNGTAIFEICFKAKVANATTNITFAPGAEALDKNTAKPGVTGQNGTVTVGSGSTGGNTGFKITIDNATVVSGQDVCVKLKTTNFTKISGVEFILTFDATKLRFKSVGTYGLSGLTDASLRVPGGTNPANEIKLSWNDPDAASKTLADGTSLFEICFTAIGGAGTTNITFGTTTTEIIDADLKSIPFMGAGGAITITGSSAASVNVTASNETTTLNQESCVKVTTSSFTNLKALNLTMTFDSTALQFKRVQTLNLTGLAQGSFTLPGASGNTRTDAVRLGWSNATGVTVTDNTSIFEVCFTGLKAGNFPVRFSGVGLNATNASNASVTVLPTNGSVTVNQPTNTTDFTLKVADASGQTNTDVCLNVTTQNFKAIVGMEFNLAFDPAFLQYKSIGSFGLTGLSESSFGLPGVGANANGTIKLSWLDNTVQGITLADNTVVFQVCFTIKGTTGSSQVRFDATKTREFTVNRNNTTVALTAFQLLPGTVTVGTSGGIAPTIASPPVITNNTCFGESKGGIDITVSTGSGNYTYKWSNTATTQDLTNLPAGAYTVTVTDSGTSLTTTATYNVTQPAAAISITNSTKTDAACFGQNSGSIAITATGGTGALAYSWNGGLAAVANPTNVAPGTYTVTIADANGCRLTGSPLTVGQATAITASAVTQNARCTGASSGSITLNISGGSSPYAVKWSNTNSVTTNVQSNLAPGTYSYTITDSKSCTTTGSAVVGSETAVRIVSIDPVFINNGNDGAVNISVTSGTAPYTYKWTGPNNYTATTEDIGQLNVPGDYCVTVTDVNSCTVTGCATLSQKLKFGSISVNDACYNQTNGSITLNVVGGQTPYTFKWSNNATTQNLSNLAAGAFTVTVTDGKGTTVSGNFQVNQLTQIVVTATTTQVTSGQNGTNGGISLSVTGGDPAYSYKWSNNATTSSLGNIGTGDYCVTVTDQKGCTSSACAKVEFKAPPLSIGSEITDVKCNGDASGLMRLQINGGVAPFVVTFGDNSPAINSTTGVVERKNLRSGSFTYRVTDAVNSTFDGNVVISQPVPLSVSGYTVRHDSEDPGCTGSIAINIAGGLPSYTVSWNSPNSGSQIINLCEGTFIPTVIDGNGCRKSFDGIVVNTFGVKGLVKNANCPSESTGGVQLQVAGGDAPFKYSWLNARGDTVARVKDLGNVPAGVYRSIVKEKSGNTLERLFTVGTTSNLSATIDVLSNFNGFAVSCPNGRDASAKINAINGGGSNYTYEWLRNDTLIASNQTIQNARGGKYKIRVTDGLGCAIEKEVVLSMPPGLILDAFISNPSCQGSRDAEIVANVGGGIQGSIYTYRWSNQSTNPRISFLSQGSYTVTVTDRNNCSTSGTFSVKDPAPIQVTIETINATENCNGRARALVKGGNKPYTFRWNAPVKTADSIAINLCPGDYVVAVTDAKGCKAAPEISMARVLDRRYPCLDMRAVISPDGDGLNEAFLINCIEEFSENVVKIYNRWGQQVYVSKNYNNDWKGISSSGETLPDGAYYYVLEYKDNTSGQRVLIKGSITLIRN